jgi:hypothetical protein
MPARNPMGVLTFEHHDASQGQYGSDRGHFLFSHSFGARQKRGGESQEMPILFNQRRHVQAGRPHHGASPIGLRPHKQVIIAYHGGARSAKPDGVAVPAPHSNEEYWIAGPPFGELQVGRPSLLTLDSPLGRGDGHGSYSESSITKLGLSKYPLSTISSPLKRAHCGMPRLYCSVM